MPMTMDADSPLKTAVPGISVWAMGVMKRSAK